MNSLSFNPMRAAAAAAAGASSPAVMNMVNRFAVLSASFSTSQAHSKKRHYPSGVKRHENDKGHPTGHGEKIYIYNHLVANHIVYSFTPDLRNNKALRQFAYTGKKLVPTSIRKDYWRPMAVVEFERGKGNVGRSVYAKCRELKKRHELEWEDEALLNMSRRERGRELNDMKGNAVADLAYVLAGNGKGNRMVVIEDEKKKEAAGREAAGEQKKEAAEEGRQEEETGEKKLEQATVYWASEQDRYFAQSWSDNVTHVVGLPPREWIKQFGAPTKQSEEAILAEEEGGEQGGEKVAA